MSGTAWLVVSGEYSDYSVTCVCLTEQEARAVADRLNELESSKWSRYDIEEVALATASEVRAQVRLFLRAHRRRGAWGDTDEWRTTVVDVGDQDLEKCHAHFSEGDGRLFVSGTDHDRVRKVFSEQKAIIQARRLGL